MQPGVERKVAQGNWLENFGRKIKGGLLTGEDLVQAQRKNQEVQMGERV